MDYTAARPVWRNMRTVDATIRALAVRYVADRRARGEIGARTAEQMRSRLLDFADTFPHTPPDKLRRRHVELWMARPGLSPQYRRARLSTLRTFCQWCLLNGRISADPTLGIRPPRLPELMPRALTIEDAAAVVRAAPDRRARLAVLLMLQEGLRRAEVAGIQLGDIDTRQRTINIRGKGGGGRVTARLPITDETWAALALYRPIVRSTSGPLLRSQRDPHSGISPARVGEIVTDAMTRAGVKLAPWDGRSPHALRHTCAHDLIDRGADIRQVQKVLRHASIRNTEWYLRGEVSGLREVMEGRRYGTIMAGG